MTCPNPTTDFFVPWSVALAHVAARETPALAERLLVQALAKGLRARGYVIHFWPPYHEGTETLDRELFTDYGPQAPPARIERDGSAIMRGWAHPHFECRILNIELSKADLLARWPGPLKRAAKPQQPSIARLVRQAKAGGLPIREVVVDPHSGKIAVVVGDPAETSSDLDHWMAKREKDAPPA